MQQKIIGFILFSLISLNVSGYAQTTNETGAWYFFFTDYNLNEKFKVRGEVHIRRTDFLKNWNQLLLRPSLHFKLNNTVKFAGGYTFNELPRGRAIEVSKQR